MKTFAFCCVIVGIVLMGAQEIWIDLGGLALMLMGAWWILFGGRR